jgi:precorrin-6B methylase 2
MNTQTEAIYSITTDEERACLAALAADVPGGGLILEVGTLYGGTTAVLALCAPTARVVTMDDYSWHPETLPLNSPELVRENLERVGAFNVDIRKGDSRRMWQDWERPIDLLWIDGGHSFEFVYSDLFNFGKFADVIALHDYDNPMWPTIRKAVETFIAKFPIWRIDNVVGMVVTLRKS